MIQQGISKKLTEIIEWIYGIAFIAILFLVIFGASKISYAYKPQFAYSNGVYLSTGLIIWFAVLWIERFCLGRMKLFIEKNSKKLIVLLTILFFFFLVYLVYNYYFITGWDAGLLLTTAQGIAGGSEFAENTFVGYYFSTYPNNIFLIFIFSKILKMESLFGILDAGNGIMGILTVQCLLSAITGFMVFKIAFGLRKSLKSAWNAWGLYVLIIGVSPWVSIPYSDSIGIIFPICILYLYMKIKEGKHTALNCFLISVVSVLGYKIKPQLFIVTIAIMITVVLNLLKKDVEDLKLQSKRYFRNAAGVILGVCITLLFSHLAVQSIAIEMNDKESFGPAHFIMMGLNPITNGGYLEDDVLYTREQRSEDRTQANIKVIKERLENYGPAGMLQHLVKKTLNNYSDGTWAWGAEGEFYTEFLQDKNQGMSPLLKSVYYYNGSRYSVFCSYSQMMWVVVLFGCFMAFLFRKNRKSEENMEYIMILAILGLTVFELIFESRARYLYCYVPVYIILGYSGVESLYYFVKKKVGVSTRNYGK